MAKNLNIDNPMLTQVIPFRQPINVLRCAWEGCNEPIHTMDGYLLIDDMTFCCDTCAAEYFMKDAGGHRVYGGAC